MRKIDQLIVSYEKRLSALKELQSLLGTDPELAAEIASALMPEASAICADFTKRPRGTQLERLKKYLEDGAWRTTDEMAAGANAAKASIAPYLYRRAELFESRQHPEQPRKRQWRLRAAAAKVQSHEKSPEGGEP